MDKLLHSYNNEFYMFDSKPKIKLFIIKKNDHIDSYSFNDLEYILAKSLLNNLYSSNNNIRSNIKTKLNKLNKFNNKKTTTILNNLDYIDHNKYYDSKIKNNIISNIYERNQRGGGLFSFLSFLLNKTYSIYTSLSVVIDVCLDILIILPRFGILTESKIMISVLNLLNSVLVLDYLGITTALLAFIPNVGDLISAVGGLGIHLYRLIKYLNKSDDPNDNYTEENIDSESDTKKQIIKNIITNNKIQLKKPNCKLVNKFIPPKDYDYDIDFYNKIKFL
jgi:hypothetical protein